jgi:hypothetical protein
MFPQMISDFYSTNVPPPSDPLSRAYEDHRSTRLRSRSPPAHSGSYSSSRHQTRSPGPRQASIDRSGGNGSLSRAYNKHRLGQVHNFWCFLPLWQFFVTKYSKHFVFFQTQQNQRSYEDYDPVYPTTVSPPR